MSIQISRCYCGFFAFGSFSECPDCGMDLSRLNEIWAAFQQEQQRRNAMIQTGVEALDWPEFISVPWLP